MTELIPDVVYAAHGGLSLALDVLRPDPPPAAPMPLVVEIHPGAWMFGGKHAERNRFLVTRGFCTASIDYRLSTQARFPAQIEDARAAVQFLRSRAEEFGIDPARVGVWGESSGGHLAALLGASGDGNAPGSHGRAPGGLATVQAVAAVSAPADLALLGNEYVPPLLGGPAEEREELAAQASPLSYLPGTGPLPPFLIIHGDSDTQVPPDHADLLDSALREAGADVEYISLPEGHNLLGSASAETVRSHLARFFTRHLTPA